MKTRPKDEARVLFQAWMPASLKANLDAAAKAIAQTGKKKRPHSIEARIKMSNAQKRRNNTIDPNQRSIFDLLDVPRT